MSFVNVSPKRDLKSLIANILGCNFVKRFRLSGLLLCQNELLMYDAREQMWSWETNFNGWDIPSFRNLVRTQFLPKNLLSSR